jgi:hypothetical protein
MSDTVVRRLATFAPPVLVALFALPFLLHQNSWWEWGNAYWMLERQSAHVAAHGVPTLFLHIDSGTFNPFFAYYAGFLFSVLAYPAALLGVWPVYAATVVAAIVGGYLGIWWTARNLGLSPQLAILPALTYTTTPWVVGEIYGRGAWAELIAVNAAAVLLGGLTALLWHPERGRGPAIAALIGSAAVIAGTHNLTLLMSAIVLPPLILAALPLRPAGSAPIVPEAARAVGAIALGVGLTAAWLIPNAWFGPSTWIAQTDFVDNELGRAPALYAFSNIFSPWPAIPGPQSAQTIYAQAPTLAILWSLIAFGVILWARRRHPDQVMLAIAATVALGIALALLIVNRAWWLHFPRLVKTVQYPVRLLPLLAMVAALATAIGLLTLRGPSRRWLVGALVAVLGVQVGAGVWVVVHSKSASVLPTAPIHPRDIRTGAEPKSFSGRGLIAALQFRVANRETSPGPNARPPAVRQADRVTSDTATLTGTGRVGDRSVAKVQWSPFVRVTGDARITGRDGYGLAQVTVTRTDPDGRWSATAEATRPWQLVVGRIISLLSALGIAAWAIAGLRRRRRDRAGGAARADTPLTERETVGV